MAGWGRWDPKGNPRRCGGSAAYPAGSEEDDVDEEEEDEGGPPWCVREDADEGAVAGCVLLLFPLPLLLVVPLRGWVRPPCA